MAVTLSITSASGLCSPAFATGAERTGLNPAESLSKEGLELRRAGRDSEALVKFEKAYGLIATPRNAAQLGLCLQALARWSEADGYLAEAISAVQDPWIQKNRTILKDASETAKSHMGRIEVLGSPEGASVTVNGRVVGTLPLKEAVKVNEGSVDIEVSAPNLLSATRTMTIVGASYQRVVLRLKPPEPVPEARAEALPAVDVLQKDSDAGAKPLYAKPWFWAAAGGVLLAAGVTAVLLSQSTNYPAADQRGTWQP